MRLAAVAFSNICERHRFVRQRYRPRWLCAAVLRGHVGGCTRLVLHQFRHLLAPSVQIVFSQRLLGT